MYMFVTFLFIKMYMFFIYKNVHVFWCFLLLCFDYIFMNKNVTNTKNTKKQLYYKKDKKCMRFFMFLTCFLFFMK